MSKVKVTWIRSQANRIALHRRTLRALGFTRLNQTVEHELTPQIKGMLAQVGYMLKVEEVND